MGEIWGVAVSAAVAVGTTYYSSQQQKKNQQKQIDAQNAAAAAAPQQAAQAQQDSLYQQINAMPIEAGLNNAALRGGTYTYVDPTDGTTKVADFSGMSAYDQQALQAQNALDLQNKYGAQFAQASIDQQKLTDPNSYDLRQQLGGNLLHGTNTSESLANGLPAVPNYQLAGNGPTYRTASDSILPQFQNTTDAGSTSAIRSGVEQDAQNQLAQIGQLDPALQRAAEQAARARGASSGNLLGDAAALKEAQSVQLAQLNQDQQRRQNALGVLTSGQDTTDENSRLNQQNNANAQQAYSNQMQNISQQNTAANQSFQDAMAAINQRNTASQAQFGNAVQREGIVAGARQQDIANQQSFLGLQPISSTNTNQFQAAPTSLNTAAANQFGQSLFGAEQSNSRLNTQLNFQASQQPSPWTTLAGSVGGSAAGQVGPALTNLGKGIYNYFNPPSTTTTGGYDPSASSPNPYDG